MACSGRALPPYRALRSHMVQSFRILLVEDDESLRLCLSEFLASQGWVVGATGHGNVAVDMARQTRFDFSILDFHLPGITGVELFRRLAAVQPLPSILMSGLASTEETVAARNAGFFRFLRKPLELAALRQTVQQLIGTHFGGPLATQLPGQPLPGHLAKPPGQTRSGQPTSGKRGRPNA